MRLLYKHSRRRYRESWLVGYRMSGGAQSVVTYNPTDDNYLALALSILGNMTSKEALKEVGLSPEIDNERFNDSKVRTMGTIAYILNTICGIPRKKTAEILKTDLGTINETLRRNGLYKDGRNRQNKQEE